ncbi:hypothetical protein F4861DRAFT_537445 [Xylaria intraflava]|nr:hypothetical protein F4861DRAFT_537445 [Xylaria intraflava]
MASMAVHYPVDKDQNHIPFWADNEELAITGDNFFEQFVTFDTGDAVALSGEVIEDPPSPSLLLDSLQNGLTTSYSHHFDWPLDNSRTEAEESTPIQPIAIASETNAADQVSPNPAILTALAADPVLSNGSISDSELLRLEGISLKSPRENVTEPSSPIFASPVRTSPRKHKRFVETIYATLRRATHRSKSPKQTHPQATHMTANLDTFLSEPGSALGIYDTKYGDPRVTGKPAPMACDGLPMSPPLTGRITNDSASGFITGNLDDPFCDRLEAPGIIYPAKCRNINTPAGTPLVNGEAFFSNEVVVPVNANIDAYRHPHGAYRSTNSAEWPTEGLLMNSKYGEDAGAWDGGGGGNPGWWGATPKGEMLHGNAAHNMAMHGQQAELPYEYGAEFSELMIHMPRPRVAQASVLTAPLNEHAPAMPSSSYPTHQHNYSGSKAHCHTERRPRPRAPSSGARHHGSQTSPRKLRHSHSLGYLREQSLSPSPRHAHPNTHAHAHAPPHHHHASHQERRQQRSSSLTMRKQRSFTRRESVASRPDSSSGQGGFGLDFVNYTPNDGNVLMTGVAPSGSSKTKARREKEAMERSRRMSELAIKAVQENGGDVSKLMGDMGHFVLQQ